MCLICLGRSPNRPKNLKEAFSAKYPNLENHCWKCSHKNAIRHRMMYSTKTETGQWFLISHKLYALKRAYAGAIFFWLIKRNQTPRQWWCEKKILSWEKLQANFPKTWLEVERKAFSFMKGSASGKKQNKPMLSQPLRRTNPVSTERFVRWKRTKQRWFVKIEQNLVIWEESAN